MLTRSNSIPLSGSPSFQPSNLSVSTKNDLICYVRFSDVVICEPHGETIKLPNSRCHIYQAQFVPFHDLEILVVTSNTGVQFWSMMGDKMLYFYAMTALLSTSEPHDLEDTFMRGISSNGSYIFVGTSLGNVLVFGIEPSAKASGDVFETGFTLLHNLQTVKNPIMCTGGSLSVLASANETGCIFTFDVSGAFELLFKHEGYGFPVTCMAGLDDVIRTHARFAGYCCFRGPISSCLARKISSCVCGACLTSPRPLRVMLTCSSLSRLVIDSALAWLRSRIAGYALRLMMMTI